MPDPVQDFLNFIYGDSAGPRRPSSPGLFIDFEVPPPITPPVPPAGDDEEPESIFQRIMGGVRNAGQRVVESVQNRLQKDQEREQQATGFAPGFLEGGEQLSAAAGLPLPEYGPVVPGQNLPPQPDATQVQNLPPVPEWARPPAELRAQPGAPVTPFEMDAELAMQQREAEAAQSPGMQAAGRILSPPPLTAIAQYEAQGPGEGFGVTPSIVRALGKIARKPLRAAGLVQTPEEEIPGIRQAQLEQAPALARGAGNLIRYIGAPMAEAALTLGGLTAAGKLPGVLGSVARAAAGSTAGRLVAEEVPFVVGDILEDRNPLVGAAAGIGAGAILENLLKTKRLTIDDITSMAQSGRLGEITDDQWGQIIKDYGHRGDVRDLVDVVRPDLYDRLPTLEITDDVVSELDGVNTAIRLPSGRVVVGEGDEVVPHGNLVADPSVQAEDLRTAEEGFDIPGEGFVSREDFERRFPGLNESNALAQATGRDIAAGVDPPTGLRGVDLDEGPVDFDALAREYQAADLPPEPASDLPFLEGASPDDVRHLTRETPEVPSAAIEPGLAPATGAVEDVEAAARPAAGQGGYLDLSSVVDAARPQGEGNLFDRFESIPFVRKFLTSAGDTPKPIHRTIVQSDHEYASLVQQAEFNVRDLNRALADDPDVGRLAMLANDEPAQAIKRQIHHVANGTADIASLPERYHDVTRAIARHRRLLAEKSLVDGVVQGDLAASFAENGDMFLSRTYRIFENKNYVDTFQKKLATGDPQAHKIKNRVVGLIRKQFPDLPEDEVQVKLNLLLGGNDNPMSSASSIRDAALSLTKVRRGFVPERLVRGVREIASGSMSDESVDAAIAAVRDADAASPEWAELRHLLDNPEGEGRKLLGQLEDRFGIAPEIRALWGEVEDISVSYPTTVSRLARRISTFKMLDSLADQGAGSTFFGTLEDAVRTLGVPASKVRKLAGEASEAWQPMVSKLGGDGVYMDASIADAIEKPFEQYNPGTFMKWMFRLSSLVKGNVTVGQVGTQVRNFTGGNLFMMSNGHLNLWDLHKYPAKLTRAGTIAGTGVRSLEGLTRAGRSVREFLGGVAQLPEEQARELFKKYQQLGIVGEDAITRQLQNEIKAADWESFGSFMDNLGRRTVASVAKEATGVYRATDDLFRVLAFESELNRYSRTLTEAGRELPADLERRVADIVHDTYQNYSLSPAWVHTLSSRVPFFGVFPAFTWQMFRTTYNTFKHAARELDDEALRSIGHQRMLGMVQVSALTASAAGASRMINGISDDDDRALRGFMPKWEKDASILYTSPLQGGQFSYINTSYTNPYSTFSDPASRLLRMAVDANENGVYMPEVAWETFLSATQLLEPFLAEDILTGYVRRAASNTNEYGSPISDADPESEPLDYYSDLLGYVVQGALTPGVVREVSRVAEAMQDQEVPGGFKRNVPNELRAIFLGVRGRTGNVSSNLRFRARKMGDRVGLAERKLNRVFSNRGVVTEKDLADAWNESESARRRLFDEMHELSVLAQNSGVSEEAVIESWTSSRGISKQEALDIVRGTYQNREINDNFMAGAEDAALAGVTNPVERFDIQETFRRRREFLSQLAREGR